MTHSATRAAAHQAIKPRKLSIAYQVYQWIASHQEGATCQEIEANLGLKHQTVSPRCSEMMAGGLILADGGVRGGSAVYRANPSMSWQWYQEGRKAQVKAAKLLPGPDSPQVNGQQDGPPPDQQDGPPSPWQVRVLRAAHNLKMDPKSVQALNELVEACCVTPGPTGTLTITLTGRPGSGWRWQEEIVQPPIFQIGQGDRAGSKSLGGRALPK